MTIKYTSPPVTRTMKMGPVTMSKGRAEQNKAQTIAAVIGASTINSSKNPESTFGLLFCGHLNYIGSYFRYASDCQYGGWMSQRLTFASATVSLTMRLVQSTAMDMFERDGYEKSTIEDVAAACGVSASTIYRHFTTKENVVLWDERDSVIDDELGRLLGSLPPVQAFRDAVVAALADREDVELFRRRLRLIYSQPSIWSVAAFRTVRIARARARSRSQQDAPSRVCATNVSGGVSGRTGHRPGTLAGQEREPLATLIDRSLTSVFRTPVTGPPRT